MGLGDLRLRLPCDNCGASTQAECLAGSYTGRKNAVLPYGVQPVLRLITSTLMQPEVLTLVACYCPADRAAWADEDHTPLWRARDGR